MKKLQTTIFWVLFLCLTFNVSAIDRKPEEILSNRALCLKVDESAVLTANLENRATDKNKIYWTSSDPTIVSLGDENRTSVTVKAIKLGQCNVTVFVDRRPLASCRVIVDDDGIIKILAIGNSFSEDAIEQNLYDIIKAEGIPVVIGNMYIGGCSLEQHLNNSQKDAANYEYRKVVDGVKKNTAKTKISQAIVDENWDFISIQQASPLSGIYSTYERDLPPVLEYVKEHNPKKETQYALHQTWAYANGSDHGGFRNYNNNQEVMYESIVDATNKAASLTDIAIVIPAGTSIQNARTSFVGDNLNRDGYHLDLHLGRYTASCTWAEKLLGLDVLSSPYIPAQLTLSELLIARAAAHNAVNNPNAVTQMAGW